VLSASSAATSAPLQPHLPERKLRIGLGVLAIAAASFYAA
jgi:hypothetical protein